jgi:hypothetical protein
VGMNWRHMAECMAAATPIYGETIDVIVRVKCTASEGSFYRSQHEFIGMFRVGKPPHLDVKLSRHGRLRSNVWRYAGADSFGSNSMDALRSPPKPVALIADAIRDCTHKGNIVLDVFSGWGSTIIAAEWLGRDVRALEAESKLVDVAIRRWQAFTGGEARHAESGCSFEQTAAARAPLGHVLAPNKTSRRRQ